MQRAATTHGMSHDRYLAGVDFSLDRAITLGVFIVQVMYNLVFTLSNANFVPFGRQTYCTFIHLRNIIIDSGLTLTAPISIIQLTREGRGKTITDTLRQTTGINFAKCIISSVLIDFFTVPKGVTGILYIYTTVLAFAI